MDEPLWTKEAPPKKGDFSFGGVVKADTNAGDGVVAGWASTPMPDLYGHIVAQGAFADSIVEAGLSGPKGIQLLIGHDWDKPAGVITKLEYRNKGLWIEAKLDLNISYAKDMYHAAKSRGGLSFSVGFRPSREPGDVEFVESETGQEYVVIRKGQLREVSVVANPANVDSIMEFIKSADDVDPLQGMVKKAAPMWRVGASRQLPVVADTSWDGAAAKDRIFTTAGIGTDDSDTTFARRAFLVYDANNPGLKGSYKLPFADVVNGRLHASPAGLRAAASRLPQTDIPDTVKARARDVIDSYLERFEKAADELTLPQLQAMLVEEGWVKDDDAAAGLTQIVRSNLKLFVEPPAQTVVKSETVERVKQQLDKLRTLLNNEKED